MNHHNDFPDNGDGNPLPLQLEFSQQELRKLLTDLSVLVREKGAPVDTGGSIYPIDGKPKPKSYSISVPKEMIDEIYTHDQPELVAKRADLTYTTPHKVDDDPSAGPVENALLNFDSELGGTGVMVNTMVFIVELDGILSADVEVSYTKDGKRVDIANLPQIGEDDFVDGYPASDEVVEKIQAILSNLDMLRHEYSFDDDERLRKLMNKLAA